MASCSVAIDRARRGGAHLPRAFDGHSLPVHRSDIAGRLRRCPRPRSPVGSCLFDDRRAALPARAARRRRRAALAGPSSSAAPARLSPQPRQMPHATSDRCTTSMTCGTMNPCPSALARSESSSATAVNRVDTASRSSEWPTSSSRPGSRSFSISGKSRLRPTGQHSSKKSFDEPTWCCACVPRRTASGWTVNPPRAKVEERPRRGRWCETRPTT